jgi:hypothetical protein
VWLIREFFLDSGMRNPYFIASISMTLVQRINKGDIPMLYVKEHEEKLVKLYRRFAPEARERILEFMEIQIKNLKLSRQNGTKTKTLSTGERIIQNLEAYLRGDYIILNKDNMDEYFSGKRI